MNCVAYFFDSAGLLVSMSLCESAWYSGSLAVATKVSMNFVNAA
jgi:hypothetical protein